MNGAAPDLPDASRRASAGFSSSPRSLAMRFASGGRPERGDRQPQRPHRGLVGDGGALGLAFLAGRTGVVLLFALCSFAALREFMTLTRTVRADHWAVAAAFFVVLPVQYWLVWTDWYGLYSIFIPVYAFLLLPILAALRGETKGFLDRVANAMGADDRGLLREPRARASLPPDPGVRGAGGAAHRLPRGRGADVGRAAIRLGQAHRAAGRSRRSLSPSKTWEGFLGGVAGDGTRRGALVDDAVRALAGGGLALVVALMGFAAGW
jgi:phosphatidate cytidylyltransferase